MFDILAKVLVEGKGGTVRAGGIKSSPLPGDTFFIRKCP